MNEQIICIVCIILNGIISVINGQPQPPFTNFAQGPLQGQGNPALFQQFLQNRQAAAGTGGIAPATGFGTQTGQIRTVTVPVLPGPGDDAGFGQGDGQFGAQTGVGGFQSDGPIPRFAQGVAGIGQPFTQFGPQGLATQGRTGFGNAGVITARQRQLAIMRRNSQAQAQRQAAAAGATSGTGPDTPALGPFSRMGLAAQNQLMMQQAPDMNNLFMTGMPMPFADQQAGADQNPMATQQALARIRAAGGLPPFAFMGASAMPGAIPPFGMFPGGRPRPPMSGAANRIVGSANGAAAGFTGDSNALFPNEPILNPRGNLQVFGSQQRPFPRVQAPGNNQDAGSPQRRFPLAPGGAAAQAASNQLNLVSSATRTRTNILTPPAVIPANVVAFPGAANNPTARVPQNIAAFPGSESNAVTVTETKSIKKNTPTMIAAFPGADNIGASDSSSKSVAVADVPAFPGMEIGNSISAAKMSSSYLQTFPAVGVTSTKSKTSSGLPVSVSLTIQGAEKPFGPGEVPPPPPVFPAKDIDNIPASVDASLFGSLDSGAIPSGSSNAWTKISGEALSSSTAGSTSSSQGTADSGSVSGRSTSTVEVRKSESSNSLTTNLQSDLLSFPGSEIGSTVRTEGENVAAPVATVPPGSAGMFPDARSSLPDFPGLDSSLDAGGVPSKS